MLQMQNKELAQRPFKIQGHFFSYTVPAIKQKLNVEIKSKLDIFFTAVYRVKKEKQHSPLPRNLLFEF